MPDLEKEFIHSKRLVYKSPRLENEFTPERQENASGIVE